MPIRSRQQQLLEHVNTVGVASVQDLSRLYDVCEMTIRRDIQHLAQSRLLRKVKGGAQRLEDTARFSEAHLRARMKMNMAAKQRLAEKAATFVKFGDTLFLDGSTTIVCLAQILAQLNRKSTVVTNSVLVALELADAENVRLICPGGLFDHETFTFCQMDNGNTLLDYHVKKAFLSCTGFIVSEGTYENSVFNMAVKRKVAQNAQTVYLLADGSKLGQRALNRVLNLEDIDVLVTQEGLSEEDSKFLEDNHIEIHVVRE